ncbi:MAG: Gfo/Idh/MocA family oxidoreductase [Clostridia bacterium]|nr:Gfo/Idh/MocA family oxidoreductase [Clostridia bacterium]
MLKVAVIGCGSISCMHLDPAVALEEAELVAVCDIKPDRAERAAQKYNAKPYMDYMEMFEKEQLDVVHICLPHYLHTKVACDAFKKGINVICEKPMSIKYEDAVAAVELAEKCGVKYGVIFQCRYNTPSMLVKQRIEDGKLGKVKCGRTTLTWYRSDNYYDHSDWKGRWEKEGGGVIIDQAIHSIDLANWMIDDTPVDIQASLHNRNHEIMVVEDTGEGLIKYENGALLSFYAMNNYFVDEPIEIRLVCENGKAIFSYDRAEISYNNGTFESVNNMPQKMVSYTGGKDYWGTQHAVQIRQFYRSVLGLEELEITGREALKIQKIICEIYDKGWKGK